METSTPTKELVNIRNLTYKYIRPCLRHFGSEFARLYNQQTKVGYAITDKLVEGSPIFKDKNLIFIKFNTEGTSYFKFFDFVEFCKKEYILFNMYNCSPDITNQTEMILVFKFPEEFNDTFINFRKGKYSKMFSKEQINTYFSGDKFQQQLKVFNRDIELRERYLNHINATYESNIEKFEDFKNYEDIELEVPFNIDLESF